MISYDSGHRKPVFTPAQTQNMHACLIAYSDDYFGVVMVQIGKHYENEYKIQ